MVCMFVRDTCPKNISYILPAPFVIVQSLSLFHLHIICPLYVAVHSVVYIYSALSMQSTPKVLYRSWLLCHSPDTLNLIGIEIKGPALYRGKGHFPSLCLAMLDQLFPFGQTVFLGMTNFKNDTIRRTHIMPSWLQCHTSLSPHTFF